MPDEKRCKECNKPVSGDRDYCPGCVSIVLSRGYEKELQPWDRKEAYRQGGIMQAQMKERMDKHMDNPC